MTATLAEKFLRFIGFEDEPEEREEHVPVAPAGSRAGSRKEVRSRKEKVVSLHGAPERLRIVVVEPMSFADAKRVADHLKERKPVLLNLENTDAVLAQRLIDFLSGATYAGEGETRKVGQGMFLFVPSHVDISGLERGDREEQPFPWVK